ncbi:probable ribose-5-phosphate isomerase 4, chloroplastic isoform X1 [Andrographis paniculata]|uniref:probable ribose-5-phosphate isomerase 4, chloroplastic isoform X1 n=1 Tax=Andrographis paniculata TaxID=175694 RepID=UPI0021E92AEF|nr:probable ribose-5-phosphate isomerase 4, chloroplastic isoform X1 [Andrographis paniculata]
MRGMVLSSSILPFPKLRWRSHSTREVISANAPPLVVCSSASDGSSILLQAARQTVDSFVENGMVIGLGSGLASGFAIQYLGRKLRSGALKDVVGVPMSVDSASEAAKAGVPMDQYADGSKIDLAFDDADVMEEDTLSAVIGRQKLQAVESIIQEKTILRAARKLVFIIAAKHYQGAVEGSIPVLIESINWLDTAEEIDDMFLGDAEVWRRPSVGYAGPLGGDFPLITKEGHNVLDVIFTSPIQNLAEVADRLDEVVGVVDHGVISRIPCTAVIATESGPRIVDNAHALERAFKS